MSVWQVFSGLMLLLGTASTTAAVIGWINMEKESFSRLATSLTISGLVLFLTGVAVFTGTLSVGFLSSAQVSLYGFWAAPLGAMLFVYGVLMPCKFEVEMP